MKRGLLFILFLLVIPAIYAFCGDGLVDDEKETCKTCLQDNPCLADEICTEEGLCQQKFSFSCSCFSIKSFL